MATRLYFVANTAPAVSPAFDGGWSSTADAVRRTMAITQAATTETLAGSVANTSTSLAVQLVSPPLAAQTISGTFTLVSRGRELNTTDNVNQRWRSVRVYSGDGATLRGTLNAYTATGSTTELAATLAGQPHAVNGSLSAVACQDGDVIVVEVGYGLSATGTTPQWEMVLGGTGTDHTTSINDATGTVPWVEFSANLTFQPVGATVTGAAEASLGFSGSAAATREALGTADTAFPFSAAVAGVRAVVAAGEAQLGFSATSSAIRAVVGGAAAAGGFSAAVVGVRGSVGAASAAFTFGATAAGARTVPGGAVADLGFSAAGSGAGVGAPVVEGAGVSSLGFAGSASGVREVAGLSLAGMGFAATALGSTTVGGVGHAEFAFAAMATGRGGTPGAVVVRPDSGSVSRPTAGVVSRPEDGVVAQVTGVVARPDAGVVVRP